jgi:hypothetical protein
MSRYVMDEVDEERESVLTPVSILSFVGHSLFVMLVGEF